MSPTDADLDPREVDALLFVAEGVTTLAGFGLAAISVVEGTELRTVAVVGDPEAELELLELRAPVDRVLEELRPADVSGRVRFLPHDRACGRLDDFEWVPDLEVDGGADAWHPRDLLCALLSDDDGVLVGVLSVDLPLTGRRPDREQSELVDLYAGRAERAVVALVERRDLAHQLAVERAVSQDRARLLGVVAHEVRATPTSSARS